ncbi:sin3 histone deacetylase corepressor complex component SDS3 [Aplysia californica]|uniref:Sin3 histone deacetylase corepressor complex component SDS3 n=1 Tax=Aplysia californica TaxID=6500 RepID=A0ABM0K2Q1_APLCA|nr:sin3 histone deacetylase corepressor complex component SDS3 [Aplysia californica]
MSSYTNSPRRVNDFDGAESSDAEEEKDPDGNVSDEDTADASETEDKRKNHQNTTPNGGQRTEIKEQMYQDKLAQIKKHIGMLQEGSLPEFLKRTKKIELQYRERLRQNEIAKTVDIEKADRNYHVDCTNAQKEFEEKRERLKERLLDHLKEKKVDLKDSLIGDLKEKRSVIELERQTIDLNGADFMEVKPTMTRKLRRRPNDPVPIPEKRRKPSPAQINLLLDDDQILADLRVMMKVSGKPVAKKQMLSNQNSLLDTSSDVRIEDGRLWYDKKWFQRNSMVQLDNKEGGPRIYGTITNIGNQEIWIKRSGDNSKLRIYISQFQKGKYVMKKRAT